MKVAVISDIHDNLTNLKKCLDWCVHNDIKEIICCGDVCNNETIGAIADNFFHVVHLVAGNMEIYDKKETTKYHNINFLGRYGIVKIDGRQIGVCHEPWFAQKIQEETKCDIIFYGHTHKPWEETKAGVRMINPGTLGGVFQKATFAVWNTNDDSVELKILEKL